MDKKTNIEALLCKKQTNVLNSKEKHVLSEWRNSLTYDPNYEKQILATISILKTDEVLLKKYPLEQIETKETLLGKKRNWIPSIAALFTICLLVAFFGNYLIHTGKKIEIRTTNYQKKGQLPDGSTYILNSNSQISYAKNFNETREVYLYGQAYFDIKHQPDNNFQVHLPDKSIINVLGTQFLVNTKLKNQTQTYLINGRLLWQSASKKEKQIPAGEALNFNAKNQMWFPLQKDSISKIALWKNKPFTFKNKALNKIIVELSVYYDTKIILQNKGLKKEQITAQFSRDLSINELLKLLSTASNFEFYLDKSKQTWVLK